MNPFIREKLKEATQSERIAIKKAAMASFFTKKSEKTAKKSDDSSNEKTDSLILFSGVDLLFNGYDEAGFRKNLLRNNLKNMLRNNRKPYIGILARIEKTFRKFKNSNCLHS